MTETPGMRAALVSSIRPVMVPNVCDNAVLAKHRTQARTNTIRPLIEIPPPKRTTCNAGVIDDSSFGPFIETEIRKNNLFVTLTFMLRTLPPGFTCSQRISEANAEINVAQARVWAGPLELGRRLACRSKSAARTSSSADSGGSLETEYPTL